MAQHFFMKWVYHTDLKPSNIFVSNPKDDFGSIASEVF